MYMHIVHFHTCISFTFIGIYSEYACTTKRRQDTLLLHRKPQQLLDYSLGHELPSETILVNTYMYKCMNVVL